MGARLQKVGVYLGLIDEPSPDVSPQVFAADPVDAVIAKAAAVSQGTSGPAVFAAPITREFALQVPAVLRGRNVIVGDIAGLPLRHVDSATRLVDRSPLLEQIDPDVANVVTLAQTVEDLVFDGLSWWEITAFGKDNFPTSARHVEPHRVSLHPPGGVGRWSLPSGVDVRSVVWVDGKPVAKSSMIRFDSPNPPLLAAGRRAIRRAALLDTAAMMYAESPKPLDYFSPSEGADPSDDEVLDVLAAWKLARQQRATAYIPDSLVRHEVQSPTPADLQLVQLQARASLDIANALGLDPEDLGVSTTSRTYANITDRRQDRINDTLAPYMLAVTARLSMNDVTRRGKTVEFDLSGFLRADPRTRAEVNQILLVNGVIDDAEWRASEGLPVRADPVVSPVVASQAAASARREVVPMRRELPVAATFSVSAPEAPPAARRVTFAVPASTADFRIDTAKRTVSGLAVPYGEVTSDWRAISFAAGSIEVPTPMSRVKAMLNHYGALLGVVQSVTDSETGLSATLKLSQTVAADEALALAADGALDGLSVGVDIHSYEIDTETDTMTVTRATLREVSLTPFPAFDSARVSEVKMTHQQRESAVMGDTIAKPDAAAAAPAAQTATVPAVPQQFTAEAAPAPVVNVSVAIPDSFAADVASAIGEAVSEARAVVDPARGEAFQVREALPYRLDGGRGEHEFSTDVFAAIRQNDGEARSRVKTFMREVFVNKSDAAGLNPNRQRPDLFVDEKSFSTPLWDAVYKGTLPDSTPFVLPKFNTAATVVSDHTEGTEPTLGTYTTTTQTITPAPLSGKFALTREIVDQGGNPQLSQILWAKIRRAWSEALEAKVNTMLAALAPTTITITTAAADAALAKEFRTKLAALQFVRGGFRFNTLPLHVDLYTAMIGAQDTTGRPLFPYVDGVQQSDNSAGTTGVTYGAIRAAGLVGVPAWALGATSVNASKSYLFDSADVHGWATEPTDLNLADQDVANVFIGVWGYQATANTDLTGVRVISFDPV